MVVAVVEDRVARRRPAAQVRRAHQALSFCAPASAASRAAAQKKQAMACGCLGEVGWCCERKRKWSLQGPPPSRGRGAGGRPFFDHDHHHHHSANAPGRRAGRPARGSGRRGHHIAGWPASPGQDPGLSKLRKCRRCRRRGPGCAAGWGRPRGAAPMRCTASPQSFVRRKSFGRGFFNGPRDARMCVHAASRGEQSAGHLVRRGRA